MEEEVGPGPVNGQAANLADQQRTGDRVKLALVLQAALYGSPGQELDQVGCRGEEYAVAVLDGLGAQGHGQMGLAHPRGIQDDDVLPMRNEVQAVRLWIYFLSRESW